MRDRVLILSVLIVASCGLGYELISSALASIHRLVTAMTS